MPLKQSLQKTWASGPQQAIKARTSCEGNSLGQRQQVTLGTTAAADGAGAGDETEAGRKGEAMRVVRALCGLKSRGLLLWELLRAQLPDGGSIGWGGMRGPMVPGHQMQKRLRSSLGVATVLATVLALHVTVRLCRFVTPTTAERKKAKNSGTIVNNTQ